MGLFNKTRRVAGFFKDFGQARRGGVAIMAGFAFPVMFIGIGGAMDYTNAVSKTKEAQRAMDAAVLALTRRDLANIDIQAEGNDLFSSILKERGLKEAPTNVEFALAQNMVSGSALVQNKNFFLTFVGMDSLEGKVSSAAVPPVERPIEIALVLDVSGSMSEDLNGQPRIQRLQTAVNAMFDKLDETLPSDAQVSASVVPYSTSVNLGNYPQALEASSAIDGLPKPGGNADVWAAERVIASNGLNYTVNDASPNSKKVPFVTASEIGDTSPTARLTALTDDIDSVRTTVNAMTPNGWTAGHIGMAWGVYSLSDKWASLWPEDPAPKGAADKIIVMLSDGQFNTTHNIGNTSLDTDPDTLADPDGSRPYKNNNQDESDAYFQNVCALARAEGMKIYAVALALDSDSETKLGNCVGASGRLYTADSANDLSKAFEDIARRLGTHRLTS